MDPRLALESLLNRDRRTLHAAGFAGVMLLAAFAFTCRQADDVSAQADPARTPLPEEYRVLAGHLADEHQLGERQQEREEDEAQSLAEISEALRDFDAMVSSDQEMAALAADSSAAVRKFMASLERLQGLPKPPDAGAFVVESFARGFFGDVVGALDSGAVIDAQTQALLAEARQTVGHLKQCESMKHRLPRIARKYCGPPVTDEHLLVIDYDEAWGPYGPDSWISLRNETLDLHNCTIQVELRSASQVVRNIHFLPVWQSGKVMHGRYSPGEYVVENTILQQSQPGVQKVVVSFWADELSHEGIEYAFNGEERDADVASYCENLDVAVAYRPMETALFSTKHRGVRLRLDGLNYVTNPRIAVKFRSGSDTRGWFWNFDKWERGEWKTLSTDGGLPWDPEEVTVEVTFPPSSYKHVSSWSAR